MIPSTHVIIFRPTKRDGSIDVNRNIVYYHSEQVKKIFRFGGAWCLIDYKNVWHYFSAKYFDLSIGVADVKYLRCSYE